MKDTYRINSSELRIDNVKAILVSLDKAFKDLGIEFYVIGALARDIMAIIHNENPIRATQDIDLAVLVSGEKNYNNLKSYLIGKANFSQDISLSYRLLFKNEIIIDLLPFGEIESAENTVTLKESKEIITLSTFGLKGVHTSAVEVSIDGDLNVTVSTFPGICILKFIAYSDRPDERAKDISDIKFIIEKYADMNVEYICNEHSDIMSNNWDENLSVRVLGRDMGKIMKDDPVLMNKILEILNSNINDNHNSKIALLMLSRLDNTLEQKIELLKNLRDGILDS
jgi:predicted nucleotidyltransferase